MERRDRTPRKNTMITTLNGLIRLREPHIKAASLVLTRSFKNDPLWLYLIPDTPKRMKVLPALFAMRIRTGIKYGEVYGTSSDLEGVAMWLPSEKTGIAFRDIMPRDLTAILPRLGIRPLLKMWSAARFIMDVRKRYAPPRYCYLASVGVDPEFQGQRFASKLVKTMLARLGLEHLPCYLETQNERNVSIYLHFGFKVLETSTIPGTAVRHWAMLR